MHSASQLACRQNHNRLDQGRSETHGATYLSSTNVPTIILTINVNPPAGTPSLLNCSWERNSYRRLSMKMPVMEGYDAVPVPVLDSTIGNTDILTRITLTFPQPLSLSYLEQSWYALVRTWPILAARIRPVPTTHSGISYYIPQPRTLETLEARSRTSSKPLEQHIALVNASDRSIASYHPIVGKAVTGSLSQTEISLGDAPNRALQDQMTCRNACRTWKQLLKADQAFVTAQATSFSDATTVTISFSHVLGDAFAIKSILQGWQDSLNGKVPPPLEDLGKDPYLDYLPPHGKNAVHKDGRTLGLPLGWTKFGLVKKMRLISNLLWDINVKRPEKSIEQFYIYVPDEMVQQLLAEARSDLEQLYSNKVTNAGIETQPSLPPNVSTFNVLFAWLLKNIHAANSNPKKLSTVVTIVNAKHRPPAGREMQDYPKHQLWGGAFGVPLKPLPCSDYASLPLGQVALHIRESIQDQVDPENIQANVVTLLKHSLWRKPSGKLIFFAEPNHYLCGCTEWRSVKFGSIDFGAAALPETNNEKAEQETVRPVAIGAHMEIPMTQRNRWAIFGDAGKGVWLSGSMTRKEASHKDGFGRYAFVHQL
ncbi:probable Acetyltransferase involved in MEL production [Ustilago trichophora]|uniref:Probable Acetyltransferase involved in MEL production n=1 Tax=Ustilago trichophora TaxID=86804 RepID=A0A5C3EJT3_9BASI|nr:probable Acetyltransferase involved in MEL production [Ustilago trichophora]